MADALSKTEMARSSMSPVVLRKLSNFRVVHNVLYRRGCEGNRGWWVAIPRNFKYDVLRACHENPTSGHEGQEKQLKRLEDRFWWPGMWKTVKQNVSGCAFCQMRKTSRGLPTGPMEPGPATTEPFAYWGIDHLP